MTHDTPPTWWVPALVVVTYYVAARLALLIAWPGSSASPIWLPAGVAVSVVALWGPWMTLSVFLGALLANAHTLHGPYAYYIAAGIALGNTAAALLVGRDFGEYGGRYVRGLKLHRAVAVSVLGAALSASIGSTILVAAGVLPLGGWPSTWATWVAGDIVGIWLVCPVVLRARRVG